MRHMKLDEYLALRGMSPPEFAKLVGVDRATIYRLKAGGQIPAKELMGRIIAATNGAVMPNDFYGGLNELD